jgi:dGTPase
MSDVDYEVGDNTLGFGRNLSDEGTVFGVGWERPAFSANGDPEPWRHPASVDSDRMLYSTEFRRLAGVTQVVPPQDDHVFHDRLTHSLKVAQVAKSLAKFLTDEQKRPDGVELADLKAVIDPNVCYVAGLAHDVGHPPFGHVAEQQLQAELEEGRSGAGLGGRAVLQDSFEGNAQSFRIVTKLSFRKDVDSGQEGLNLTWRSLAAIAKYPWMKGGHPSSIDKLSNKWGVYNTEKGYLDQIEALGLIVTQKADSRILKVSRSIEAEIMDWADDIAYAVHDLEDFFRSGRISLDSIARSSLVSDPQNSWETFFGYVMSKFKKLIPEDPELAEIDHDTAEKFLKDFVLALFPDSPFNGTRAAHASLQSFGSEMIRLLQNECRVVEDGGRLQLKVSANGRLVAEFLKSITQYHLIHDPAVETMQMGQRKVVSDLFRTFHELTVRLCVDGWDKPWLRKRLPVRLQEYASAMLYEGRNTEFSNDDSRMARAVVDFICGLTDRQALLLHRRLSGDSRLGMAPGYLNT